jgi:hypothetical protein
MGRLSISQVPGSNPPQFIARNRDTEQSASAALVPSPYGWPVPGTGDDKLMVQLRWYLETFLSYPFEPYTIRAAHIEDALKAWGTAAFKSLFNNLDAGLFQFIHRPIQSLPAILNLRDAHPQPGRNLPPFHQAGPQALRQLFYRRIAPAQCIRDPLLLFLPHLIRICHHPPVPARKIRRHPSQSSASGICLPRPSPLYFGCTLKTGITYAYNLKWPG